MTNKIKWIIKWKQFKAKVRTWWYRVRYDITVDLFGGSILPSLGEGRFVSVRRKGNYIDIVRHVSNVDKIPIGTIRLIPAQYNHGLMVEWLDDKGNVHGRSILSYDELYRKHKGQSEMRWNGKKH